MIVAIVLVAGVLLFVYYSAQRTGPSSPGSTTSTSVSQTTSAVTSSNSHSQSQTSTGLSTFPNQSQSTTMSCTSSAGSTGFASPLPPMSPLEFAWLLGNYSSLGFTYSANSTANGQTYYFNQTHSYQVIYHSSTTYKTNITVSTTGSTVTMTAWIKNDGALVALYTDGENYTGTSGYAQNMYNGTGNILQFFGLIAIPENFISSYGGYMHVVSTGTIDTSGIQFSVSNYAAYSTPFTAPDCTTVNSLSFQFGAPRGTLYALVTNFSTSFSTGGNPTNKVIVNEQLTAVTTG